MIIELFFILFFFFIINSCIPDIENLKSNSKFVISEEARLKMEEARAQQEGGGATEDTEDTEDAEELQGEQDNISRGYNLKNRIIEIYNQLCGSQNCNVKSKGSTGYNLNSNTSTLEDIYSNLEERAMDSVGRF